MEKCLYYILMNDKYKSIKESGNYEFDYIVKVRFGGR